VVRDDSSLSDLGYRGAAASILQNRRLPGQGFGAVYRRSVRDAVYAAAVVLGAWIGLHWGLLGVATGVLIAVILNNILAIRMSLKLLNCSWLEYTKAQAPGVFLAIMVALVLCQHVYCCTQTNGLLGSSW